MVEKHINISESQDEALKSLAEALGVSEEEVIQQALAEFLRLNSFRLKPRDGSGLEQFLAVAQEVSKKHRLPEGYRFSRAELYGEYGGIPPENPPEK